MTEKCDICKTETDCQPIGDLNVCQDCIEHAYGSVGYPKDEERFPRVELKNPPKAWTPEKNPMTEKDMAKHLLEAETCGSCGNRTKGFTPVCIFNHQICGNRERCFFNPSQWKKKEVA